MRVWLLKIGEPVPTSPSVRRLRTGMLAEQLAVLGHEVVWWTSAFDHHAKLMRFADREEIRLRPGLTVRALRGIGYRRNVSLRRYADHWWIARKFREAATQEPAPDVIVTAVPDHHLAYEAVAYGRSRGIPVIADVRDGWPDVFLDVVPAWSRPLVRRVLCRDQRKLAATLAGADALTAMTSGWLEWGLRKAGRQRTPGDRVFYLGAPRLAEHPAPVDSERVEVLRQRLRGRFVVTFIGTWGRSANPLVVARAARLVAATDGSAPPVGFVLAGDGPFRPDVQRAVAGLDQVFCPGWLHNDEIEAVLRISSVGVVPVGVGRDQFPNKAFTYLSGGLPVLAAGQGDLSQLLTEYQAGLLFPADDPGALARQIDRLRRDEELSRRMAENAYRLFAERLDAGPIYTAFAQHIEQIASPHIAEEVVGCPG